MKCKFIATDEVHRSGRQIVRCERHKCTQKGLLPTGGPGKLDAKCYGIPRKDELGCWASIIFEVFRITPRRVSWLKRLLGFKKPCKCHQREEALNSWGAWAWSLPGKLWSAIKSRAQT